jgi:hypothetical protein
MRVRGWIEMFSLSKVRVVGALKHQTTKDTKEHEEVRPTREFLATGIAA